MVKKTKKKYHCKICGKYFSQKSNLNTHSRIHYRIKPYFCNFDFCRKQFTTKGNLNTHTLTHIGIKKYFCPDCDKSFYCEYRLKVHLRIHVNIE